MPVCLGLQTHWSINCIYSLTHAREVCLPTVKIYSQLRANTYSFAELNLCQDFSDTQSGEHKWKMEQNKQAHRQIFGSYSSNLSNSSCLQCKECKGGAELPTLQLTGRSRQSSFFPAVISIT